MGLNPFPCRGIRKSLEHASGFATKSRGVTYTGYRISSNAEKGDEGEKTKRATFFTILPAHCASVAATLSQGPTGWYTYVHVPIDCIHIYIYIYIYIIVYIYIYIYIYTYLYLYIYNTPKWVSPPAGRFFTARSEDGCVRFKDSPTHA